LKDRKVCGVNWTVIPHINCPTTKGGRPIRITELYRAPLFT